MFRAAIFDLDGTAADTLESIACTMNRCLVHFGLEERPVAEYQYYAGDGAKKMAERALEAAGDGEAALLEPVYAYYLEQFREGCLYHVRSFEGLEEVLWKMKRSGMKLAVCTNKPDENAKAVVRRIYGEKLFDEVLGEGRGFLRKPSPEGPLWLAERLGALPGECLYAGDTDTDMRTGRAAGMYTVGVLWGFRTEQELLSEGAQGLAKRPEDLLKFAGISDK